MKTSKSIFLSGLAFAIAVSAAVGMTALPTLAFAAQDPPPQGAPAQSGSSVADLARAVMAKSAAERKEKTANLTEKQKLSYALGIRFGSDMKHESLDVDPDMFVQGITDVFSGSKTLLTAEEIHGILTDLQADLKRNQASREAERVIAAARLAEKNKKDGNAFQAENKAKEGVMTLESGLQYEILKVGAGRKPKPTDTVVVHYRGTFVDGAEFDDSYKRGEPVTSPLTRAIAGWKEALQLMPVGSKWRIVVPPALGYGAKGQAANKIGPNATLVFEVELLRIVDKPNEHAQASK